MRVWLLVLAAALLSFLVHLVNEHIQRAQLLGVAVRVEPLEPPLAPPQGPPGPSTPA